MACLVVACVRNRDGSGPRIGGVLPPPEYLGHDNYSRRGEEEMGVLGSRRCLSDRFRDCTTIYELSKAILSQSPRSVILSQVCKQIAGEYPSLPKIQLARRIAKNIGGIKINLLKNTIFVEKYLTIADLFKSYFLAILSNIAWTCSFFVFELLYGVILLMFYDNCCFR